MKPSQIFFLASALFMMMSSMAFNAAAQSEGSVLFVAPHRVVFSPETRVEVLNVANKSSKTHRYDLTVIDQVMDEKGVTKRQDTFDYSAKKMLRFVPKRFTLKPGERQVVRVMVMRPEGLQPGDYHSHLLFREVPLGSRDKERLREERGGEDKALSFEIRALYGVAVPIVVQHGKVESSIDITGKRIIPGDEKALEIVFNRKGNAETAGRLSVTYEREGEKPLHLIDPQWVRIYREVDTITRQWPLSSLPQNARGGKIVIKFFAGESEDAQEIVHEISNP